MLQLLDVFSGIGAASLGFERAGGFKTIAFCENNEFRRSIIKRHFPGVFIHDDVRTADFCGFANVVAGGPPCQKTSVAAAIHGKRTGETLWPHMLRAGLGVEAEWFVVEQPAGNKAWEEEVSSGLARNGYHCARIEFAACDCGAVSQRRRLFILANRNLSRLACAWRSVPFKIDEVKGSSVARRDWSADLARLLRMDARSPHRVDRRQRIEALGDANPPHMSEVIGLAILAGMGA